MHAKTVAIALLLCIPPAAAVLPLPFPPAPMPVHTAEAPVALGSQTVCREDGTFCARADLYGVLVGCEGGSCTVQYMLYFEAGGLLPGCAEAESSVTSYYFGCNDLPGQYNEAFKFGEKTYPNVQSDSAVSEWGRICVYPPSGQRRCDSFTVTVRFPAQHAAVTNATTSYNTQVGHASATICRDPSAESPACVNLEVVGRVADCTGVGAEKSCLVTYTTLQTQAGFDACSTLVFIGTMDRTACAAGPVPYVYRQEGGAVRTVGDAARVREEGSFCLDGDGGRCVGFVVEVPIS